MIGEVYHTRLLERSDSERMKRIGVIGFGRIGSSLCDKINQTRDLKVDYVYEIDREKSKGLDKSVLIADPKEFDERKVDLVVEAADFRAVEAFAPRVLKKSDMLILSASALANADLEKRLQEISAAGGHRFYVPHGALLGMDGFQDARQAFDEVSITTIKAPKNLDFTFQTKWKMEEIKTKTILHDGPVRESCKLFPRNVNSHAVLALSSLGFDKTRSILVADPTSTVASHHIVARGGGATTEIIQASPIKGVTGDFTLASVFGTVQRMLVERSGLNIV